jgi:serine protease
MANRRFAPILALTVLVALLFSPSPANAAGGDGLNPSRRASDAPPGSGFAENDPAAGRYIITFQTYGSHARGAVIAAGGDVTRELPEVSAIAAKLPEQAVVTLRNNPLVKLVEPDALRYPMQATPLWSDLTVGGEIVPYGIQMVQANELSGVAAGHRKVCIIDSGYGRSHIDLQKADVTASPDTGTGDPFKDFDGHGTHVAGTIAAIGANATGVVGTVDSGRLKLHIVKVFGDSGTWTYSSDLVNAVTQCRNAGSNIISMSLGGSNQVAAENTAFTNAYNAGVLSIAAAGNAGTNSVSYPGGYTSVVSVAAVDANEVVASFSQYNSTVELAAPGVAVLSTVPYNDLNSVAVGDTTKHGNHIEYAARSLGVTGLFVSGGRCTATNGAWSGRVVLCERGDISFFDKVRFVQQSGGVAAVIYNNEPGSLYATLGDGNSSTIPAISLSQADGQALFNAIDPENIESATVASLLQKPALDGYDWFNGTSMATPHVSGVAALIWSYNPNWTNVQIRNALQATAKDKGAAGRDNYYGYGIVQAKAALESLCGPGCTPTPPVPPTPAPVSACFTDTAVSDFGHYAGVLSNIDLQRSEGDASLAYAALETLDQQQTSIASFDAITTTSWSGQTFQPGVSGRLTGIEFRGYLSSGAAGAVGVEIRTASGGLPTGTVLASASFPLAATAAGYHRVNFPTPASVTAGTSYAIVFRVLSGGTYAISRPNNDQYTNGTIVKSTDSGSTWSATNNRDHYFKTFMIAGATVYLADGTLESNTKDSAPDEGYATNWTTLSWSATTPVSTSIRFQVAGSASYAGPFHFVGPDGTSGSYFTLSGASLAQFAGLRYLRYRAHLSTSDSNATPILHAATACYETAAAACDGATPVVTASGGGTFCEGADVDLSANVIDGATYEWSGPNGFTSTLRTPTISNITTAGSGTYTVVATLGGCASAPSSVVVNVGPIPTLGSYADTTIAAAAGTTVTPSAAPTGAANVTVAASALFTGTVSVNASTGVVSILNANRGGHTITVTATSSCGATAVSSFTLTATNNAPVLSPIGDRSGRPGETLSFTVSATDADGDALSYSATGLPTGATLDQATGEFSWTPGSDQSGAHEVTFSVSDGMGGTDSEQITIRVSAGMKFYTLTPCRVIDTRLENGAYGSPALEHASERSFVMTGECGIPATAKAVSLNATITGPTNGPGFLTLYPGGTERPVVSMLNYIAGQTRTNNAIAPLGTAGSLTAYIRQGTGEAHLIIDVNGYFE